MLEEAIQRGGNLGILDGPASGVVDVDIDADAEVDVFLALNPRFAETMCTRGANGCRFWLRPIGDYPARRICAKKKIDGHNKPVAEFRGGGGHQSIVWGLHPLGKRYVWLKEARLIEIRFEEIIWPPGWGMDFSAGGNLKDFPEPRPAFADPIELGSINAEALTHIELVCKTWAPAVSGDSGHNTTIALAVRLAQSYPELSASQLLACIARFYNPRCRPPWTLTELKHKVADAIKLVAAERKKQAQPYGDRQQVEDDPSRSTCKEIDVDDLLPTLDDDEPLPPFPLDTLPKTFRTPVEEVMRHYRVPALMPAICALVINSAALGRGIVTKSNVRRTYPNLYAMIGAKSGTGKTVVFDEFMAPFEQLQHEMLTTFTAEEKPRAAAELKLI